MKPKLPDGGTSLSLAAIAGRIVLFLTLPASLCASPLYSPTWGFRVDPPEGYEYTGGNGVSRFSFASPLGAALDLAVYDGTFPSVEALASDATRRLGSAGETAVFDYRGKKACLITLLFPLNGNQYEGWGLCLELAPASGERGGDSPGPSPGERDGERRKKILLLGLAYGPADVSGLEVFHLSALDSIAPSESERRASGPVTAFAYPPGELLRTPLASGEAGATGVSALFAEHDAEGAQALVDREFDILRRYAGSPLLKDARIRFYRAIFRDSWERLSNAAFILERRWNSPDLTDRPFPALPSLPALPAEEKNPGGGDRAFAEKVLSWIQSFTYERDVMGSDFVNLVSAATEERGDCDSRAMLFAIILSQAGIPAAIMVSPDYSHAMGLVDVRGKGARFEAGGTLYLVAETTVQVDLGLIHRDVSVSELWSAVMFE
jgi:hypothetical protein